MTQDTLTYATCKVCGATFRVHLFREMITTAPPLCPKCFKKQRADHETKTEP